MRAAGLMWSGLGRMTVAQNNIVFDVFPFIVLPIIFLKQAKQL
jgi:hypothetical protein